MELCHDIIYKTIPIIVQGLNTRDKDEDSFVYEKHSDQQHATEQKTAEGKGVEAKLGIKSRGKPVVTLVPNFEARHRPNNLRMRLRHRSKYSFTETPNDIRRTAGANLYENDR